VRQGESVLQRRISLVELLDGESFTEVVKGFVELYKVGIKVFDDKGGKLADIKVGNGDFCGYVFSFPEGRRRCTSTVGRVKDGPVALSHGARLPVLESTDAPRAKGVVTVPCFTGLRYIILPILWEGDTLGRVVFGPFFPEDLGDFPPPSLTEVSEGFDAANARKFVEKVRRAPESTIARVLLHFAQLLQTLLFAGPERHADRAARARAGIVVVLRQHPSRLHHHRAARRVVGGTGGRMPRVEVAAQHHNLARRGTRNLGEVVVLGRNGIVGVADVERGLHRLSPAQKPHHPPEVFVAQHDRRHDVVGIERPVAEGADESVLHARRVDAHERSGGLEQRVQARLDIGGANPQRRRPRHRRRHHTGPLGAEVLVVGAEGEALPRHVVGGQFDTVYREGAYDLTPGTGGSQVLGLFPAQGGFVELTLPEAGNYPFVSHTMSDAERGATGILQAIVAP